MHPFPTRRKNNHFSLRFVEQKLAIILVTLFIIQILLKPCLAQTSEQSYTLLNQPDGSKQYKLTISITQTLYDYYQSSEHQITNYSDLAKFVTPSPLEPIANDLWGIYDNPEDFANGVLMITHQIPYQESMPQKYPVETLRENEGDCDLFSYIAASIMKAGGLDITLLLFEEQNHMTVGIHLPETPKDARTVASYFTYDQKRYFIAECTGNFESGWRVGETPDLLHEATAQIIPLDEIETEIILDKVSSSYSSPQDSSLLLSVSSEFAIAQNDIRIMGSIFPSLEGENITLYISSYGSSLTKLATVQTNSDGFFSHTWISPPGGIYSLSATWSGDDDYIGSDSTIPRIVIIPSQWLMMGAIVFFFLVILLIVTLATRGNESQNLVTFQDWEADTLD
jgi:hypothetical protein